MKKPGAILFVIMGVLMICAFIMYASMRNTSYFITLVHEREKGGIHYYYAYSLQQFILHNYQNAIKKITQDKANIFSADWPHKNTNNAYKGYAWVEFKKGVKTLYIELKQDRKTVISLPLVL